MDSNGLLKLWRFVSDQFHKVATNVTQRDKPHLFIKNVEVQYVYFDKYESEI